MKRIPRRAGVVGGVFLAGAVLLGSAAPALAGPGDTSAPGADPLTALVGGTLSSLPGGDPQNPAAPTPAPTDPYAPGDGQGSGDAHPLGIPVAGALSAVLKGATSLAPSGPYDASAPGPAVAHSAGKKVFAE